MCVANSSWQTEKEAEEPYKSRSSQPPHNLLFSSQGCDILTFWTRQGLGSLQQQHLQAPSFSPHPTTLPFACRGSLTLGYLCTHITLTQTLPPKGSDPKNAPIHE